MSLFRWMKAALYRWRIARIDRRLDALQARHRDRPGRTDDAQRLGLEFDALAIDRAVIARRLGRLANGTPATTAPRRSGTAESQAAQVERYLQLDEALGAAREGDPDGAAVERLSQQLAAAQHEIESARARRAP